MVEYLKIDKQGRITIPAQIRNVLSISENNILEIDLQANQIVIRKKNSIDQEEIEKWFNNLSKTSIPALKESSDHEESKYYSDEYVKQKLGI